ncbi:type IV pilus assembly protein FimV [Stutzerimonas frequens]|uniref:type IV pilus assembly protein FimV n=1 Tax=Stutzerimonas frequens TaxID=2968969 RepID=UPI00403835D5
MSSFRLAVWPFILLAACYTPLASALGLGEISLHSALAEPLEADIELIDARGLGADDIKVRLAPNHVFARAGVERPDILAKLSFVPALDAGSQRIRVSSTTPVNEPYLNFIVELTLPGGQLLREYTLLLDPPLYQPDLPTLPLARPTPAVVGMPPAEPEPARTLPMAEQGKRYRIQPGDSLWAITARLQGGKAGSREALMADLYALNPDAFIGGDRNRLRVGAEMLLPDHVEASTPRPTAPTTASDPVSVAAVQVIEHVAVEPSATPDRSLEQVLGQLEAQVVSLQAQMEAQNRLLIEAQQSLAQREASPAVTEPYIAQVAPSDLGAEAHQPSAAPFASALAAPALAEQPDSSLSSVLLAVPALLLLAGLLLRRRSRAAAAAALVVEPRPVGAKRAEASFPDINPFQRQVPMVTEMTVDEYLGHHPTERPAPVAALPQPTATGLVGLRQPSELDELIANASTGNRDAVWRAGLSEALGCLDRGELDRATSLLATLLGQDDSDQRCSDAQLAQSA